MMTLPISTTTAKLSDIVDDLERIHLQLAILEYRIGQMHEHASRPVERRCELGDKLKGVIERIPRLVRVDVANPTRQSNSMMER